MTANITDITDLTDAELDALFGIEDDDDTDVLAESRALRLDYDRRHIAGNGYRRGPNSPR